jgi:D-alanyl-D-alanine carboxypeptidase
MVTQHAASCPDEARLKPGATIKTSDAIKALVTHSANDAAAVIAENIAGTEENFGRLMTQTARNMGMKNTIFRNASGLPNPDQVTTARDMAILAVRIIRDYPEYYDVFETRSFSFRGPATGTTTAALRTRHRRHQDGLHEGERLQPHRCRRDNKHLVAVLGGKTGVTSVMPPCGPRSTEFAWPRRLPQPKSHIATLIALLSEEA